MITTADRGRQGLEVRGVMNCRHGSNVAMYKCLLSLAVLWKTVWGVHGA